MTAINTKFNLTENTMKKTLWTAQAIAKWLETNNKDKVIVGYHNDINSKRIAETIVRVLGEFRVRTNFAIAATTDKTLQKGIVMTKSCLGIMCNAHQQSTFDGIQLFSTTGKPLSQKDIQQIKNQFSPSPMDDLPTLEDMMDEGLLNHIDLKILYTVASNI